MTTKARDAPLTVDAGLGDAELVQRTRDGDSGAFEALMVRYGRMVRVMISRHENIEANVEELALTAFGKAFRGLFKDPNAKGGLQDPSKFGQWIGTIATRKALSEAKKGARRKGLLGGTAAADRAADRALDRSISKEIAKHPDINIPGMFKRSSGIAEGAEYNPHDDPGDAFEPVAPTPHADRGARGWRLIRAELREEIDALKRRVESVRGDELLNCLHDLAQLEEQLRLAFALPWFVAGLPRLSRNERDAGFAPFRGNFKGYRPPKWVRGRFIRPGIYEQAALVTRHEPVPVAKTPKQRAIVVGIRAKRWPARKPKPGDETYLTLDTTEQQAVAVMVLLATVAHPESVAQRERAARAMQALAARAAGAAGQAGMTTRDQARALDSLRKRLEWRLYAAQVGTLWYRKASRPRIGEALAQDDAALFDLLRKVRGSRAGLVAGKRDVLGGRWTLNEIAARSPWPDNFMARVWKPEALHLAMALLAAVERLDPDYWTRPDGLELDDGRLAAALADPGWIVEVLHAAESLSWGLRLGWQLSPHEEAPRTDRQIRLIPRQLETTA